MENTHVPELVTVLLLSVAAAGLEQLVSRSNGKGIK